MANEEDGNARLRELCRQRLSPRRLILASNRGPIEYHLTEGGQLQARRGSGGVVAALTSLGRYLEIDWVASAMGEGDRQAVQRMPQGHIKASLARGNLYLRFVLSPRNTYHKFYNILCNPLLWFLQHYMWHLPRTPNIDHTVHDAWENGYISVNQAFAQAIIEEVGSAEPLPIVLLHDYHLYLAGGYIKQQRPDLLVQHFVHLPWPGPLYWQLLPDSMRSPIMRSLCSIDIVGLQTTRDARNFLHCCQSFISQAEVDYQRQTVKLNDHTVQVKTYPISIDVAALQRLVASPTLREYEPKLRALCGEQTIVRVDRVEPSQNILRGFRAFDLLLERYPEFRGKVKLIAFLVPTKTHLRPYQRYTQEVTELIEAVNSKYATESWRPVEYLYENNYIQAIAGMCLYDVLLINAAIDGMNLVAKEGPIANNRDGVLILSETTGAYEQLGANCLTVAATDIEGTTQALYTALTMPPDERKRRAEALKKAIEEEDLTNWLWHLLDDVAVLAEQRYQATTAETASPEPFQIKG